MPIDKQPLSANPPAVALCAALWVCRCTEQACRLLNPIILPRKYYNIARFFRNGAKNLHWRCVLHPAPSGAVLVKKTLLKSRIESVTPILFMIEGGWPPQRRRLSGCRSKSLAIHSGNV